MASFCFSGTGPGFFFFLGVEKPTPHLTPVVAPAIKRLNFTYSIFGLILLAATNFLVGFAVPVCYTNCIEEIITINTKGS